MVRPRPKSGEVIENRVWVGGLPNDITEERLEEFLSPCGEVANVHIKWGARDTFAFVTMADSEGYDKVLRDRDRETLDGREVRVNVVLKDAGGGKGNDKGNDRRHSDEWSSNRSYHSKGGGRQDDRSEESVQVWVGGLPEDIVEQDIHDEFSRCGQVTEVAVRRVRASGDTIAFIRFEKHREAMRAVELFNKSECFGPSILCELARSKGDGQQNGYDDRRRERSSAPNYRYRSRSRSALPRANEKSREVGKGDRFRVHIENLPGDVHEDEFWSMVSEHGEVVSLDMWREGKTRAGRVDFETKRAAEKCVDAFDNRRIEGWDMRLSAYRA